jgi:hypothetical protein
MTMRHPLEAIPAGKRVQVFVPLFVLSVALMIALNLIGAPLQTLAAPAGIVSFELAGSVGQTRAILESWDQATRLRAAFSLGLDYVFMVVYSTAIGLACAWAASVTRASRPRWAVAGSWLAWGQWLAALLDAVENVALTVALFGTIAAPWPQMAWWCATLKFLLILAGLAYALVSWVVKRA